MNLYLRLFLALLKGLFAKKQSLYTSVVQKFRVLPLDCDLNCHLTNSRYLSFMDLGRIYLLGKLKLINLIVKNRWMPVIAAAEISFIKPLKPLQKFHLITKVIAWDEKYYYFEQRFEANNELYAFGLAKGLFIDQKGEKIAIAKLNELLGEDLPEQPLPEAILKWKNMTEAKKDS